MSKRSKDQKTERSTNQTIRWWNEQKIKWLFYQNIEGCNDRTINLLNDKIIESTNCFPWTSDITARSFVYLIKYITTELVAWSALWKTKFDKNWHVPMTEKSRIWVVELVEWSNGQMTDWPEDQKIECSKDKMFFNDRKKIVIEHTNDGVVR